MAGRPSLVLMLVSVFAAVPGALATDEVAPPESRWEEYLRWQLENNKKLKDATRAWYLKQLRWIEEERRKRGDVHDEDEPDDGDSGDPEPVEPVAPPPPPPPAPPKPPVASPSPKPSPAPSPPQRPRSEDDERILKDQASRATEVFPLFRIDRRRAALDGFVEYARKYLRDPKVRGLYVEKFRGVDAQTLRTPEPPLDLTAIKLCELKENIYKTRGVSTSPKQAPPVKSLPSKYHRSIRHDKAAMLKISRAFNKVSEPSRRYDFWLAFMACTAQAESGGFWDRTATPSKWRSAAGDVGLFQFNPSQKGGGNLIPCIREWNEAGNSPELKPGNLVQAVGAPQQHFQVFCAVQKLKANLGCQQERSWRAAVGTSCVSPFNDCYQHFGSHTWTSNRTTDCMLEFLKRGKDGTPIDEFDEAFMDSLANRYSRATKPAESAPSPKTSSSPSSKK